MSVGNAKMAKQIVETYSEGDSLQKVGEKRVTYTVCNDEMRKDLDLNKTQQDTLNSVLGDGIVEAVERKALSNAGFSDEFVDGVSGKDGKAALRKRITWLADNVGRGFWSHGDPVQRLKNALEFKKASSDLFTSGPVEPDAEAMTALGKGAKETKQTVADLLTAVQDKDLSDKERHEALKGLAALGTDESVRAYLTGMETPDLAVSRVDFLSQLGDVNFGSLNRETRDAVMTKLTDVLDSNRDSSQKDAAIGAMNRIFLRAIDTDERDSVTQYGMDKLEQFALRKDLNPRTKMYALIATVNTGRSGQARDELLAVAGKGENQKTVTLAGSDPKTLAGGEPAIQPGEEYSAFKTRQAQYEQRVIQFTQQVAQAQSAVADAKAARQALTWMQRQIDASTSLRPSGLSAEIGPMTIC